MPKASGPLLRGRGAAASLSAVQTQGATGPFPLYQCNVDAVILHDCLLSDLDAALAFDGCALRDGFRIFSDFHRLLTCIKGIGRLVFVQVELLDEGLLPFYFLSELVGVLEGLANLFVQV